MSRGRPARQLLKRHKRHTRHEDGRKAPDCPKKKADRRQKAKPQAKGFLTTSSGFLTAPAENEPVGKWYVNSCCSYHFTNEKENMVNFSPGKPINIAVANSEVIQSAGQGNVMI